MVHLRGMVQEGWYMVQESKLWYDYIIMVRSGNDGVLGVAKDCLRFTRPSYFDYFWKEITFPLSLDL